MIAGLWFDAPLLEIANPEHPENPAKAPWYFLGLQELVSYSALTGGVLVPGLILLGLILIPYIVVPEKFAFSATLDVNLYCQPLR